MCLDVAPVVPSSTDVRHTLGLFVPARYLAFAILARALRIACGAGAVAAVPRTGSGDDDPDRCPCSALLGTPATL
jgi:hypothetical protein